MNQAEPPEPSENIPPPPILSPEPFSFKKWLFGDRQLEGAAHAHRTSPWWKVMCLTGVDYFSTLGYQPGIAFLAAGVLSPVATLVLVAVTLGVALPVYMQVARRSPHGQGSIKMLEDLLPRWRGKVVVLVLLGFALTSFIITITLSAADATAHIVENPYVPHWLHHRIPITLVLIGVLGGIFLKGFREAIGVAVGVVAVYLVLNAVVLTVALKHVFTEAAAWGHWKERLFGAFPSPWRMLAHAALLFPGLALGLSGFETGVAVM